MMRIENVRKGPWYEEEDERLKTFVAVLGARRWDTVAKISGLRRSGKSCRLRWLNYLRPCLKHGFITPQEHQLILKLHDRWGNKWAKIARRLPGRTDNEVKNYWRSHLRKEDQMQNSLLELHHSTSSSSSSSSSSSPASNVSSIQTSSSSDYTTMPNNYSNQQKVIPITPEIHSDDSIFEVSHYDDEHKGSLSDSINSPYENRLSDWMNMLSEDLTYNHNYSPGCWEINNGSPDLCLDYPITCCFEYATVAWDTNWDMDLFNLNL